MAKFIYELVIMWLMSSNLNELRTKISAVIDGLESTLCAAADELRSLGGIASDDYADCILNHNRFGGDTAEIYFYRFAPKGCPRPDSEDFFTFMSEPDKASAYRKQCYLTWASEIHFVEPIVEKYGGHITVDGLPLDSYLLAVVADGHTPDHRVHVGIEVPGQGKLYSLKKIISE